MAKCIYTYVAAVAAPPALPVGYADACLNPTTLITTREPAFCCKSACTAAWRALNAALFELLKSEVHAAPTVTTVFRTTGAGAG